MAQSLSAHNITKRYGGVLALAGTLGNTAISVDPGATFAVTSTMRCICAPGWSPGHGWW